MMSTDAYPHRAIAAICTISFAATLFLFWLIYFHPASDAAGLRYAYLPALNASLNGLSAIALLLGVVFVRSGRIAAHRVSMMSAFIFSTAFLFGYILHHALHGDIRYPIGAPLRGFYLTLLATHIVLAIGALPMVLATFFLGLGGSIPAHRRIARWTFPVWLYVSVTGVITFAMLRLARG
jgi:putative membrane protein